MNNANSKIYGIMALVAYIGFMVGLGFILDLFWTITPQNATMFWVTTAKSFPSCSQRASTWCVTLGS